MSEPRFSKGEQVRHRTQTALFGEVCSEPELRNSRFRYRVVLASGQSRLFGEHELERFDPASDDPAGLFAAGVFGDRQSVVSHLTFLRIRGALSNYVYSFQNSRTRFYEHQFKPLVKFLGGAGASAGRILIADEVGLGKTIEAGLILYELNARNLLRRALVVCPAALRTKWRRELLNRFDFDFRIHDVSSLLDDLRQCRRNPTREFRGIISYAGVRQKRVRRELSAYDIDLDVVVADEAHRMRNAETSTYAAGQALAALSRNLVLLTATPINNSEFDLFNQLALLDPALFQSKEFFEGLRRANEHVVAIERLLCRGAFDPGDVIRRLEALAGTQHGRLYSSNPYFSRLIEHLSLESEGDPVDHRIEAQRLTSRLNFLSRYLNRTRRVHIEGGRPEREAQLLRVPMHPLERALYDSAYALAMEHYNQFKLPVMSMERVLASCLPAFVTKYGASEQAQGPQPDLNGDVEHLFEDDEIQGFQIPGLRTLLASKGQELLRAEVDTKLDRFLEMLDALEEDGRKRKALVFSSFKATIRYLSAALDSHGVGHVAIHGDIPSFPDDPERDERERLRTRFATEPEVQVLLSSEVGSEGLDFQFCHVVVNYDLPWNPMRVEQRIGRIDRIGQASEKLFVRSLVLAGSVDDRIYEVLQRKIGLFERSIGDIEAILGRSIATLRKEFFDEGLTPEEQSARLEREAEVLVRRRKALEDLESEASRIIGADQYVREEVRRIQTGRRYVAKDEIASFVHELLRRPAVNADIEEVEVGVFRARITSRVRNFMDQYLDRSLPSNLFRGRLRKDFLTWTFDQELAEGKPAEALELFNLSHPAVRALSEFVAAQPPGALTRNFMVELDTEESGCPPGAYALALYQTTYVATSGNRRELIALALNLSEESVGTKELGDRLLAGILTGGRDSRGGFSWTDPAEPHDIVEAIEEAALDHCDLRANELEDEETIYLAQRREQIVADAQRQIAFLAKQLDSRQEGWRRELDDLKRQRLKNLMKAVETRMQRAEARREESLADLPEVAKVAHSRELKSLGLVVVS